MSILAILIAILLRDLVNQLISCAFAGKSVCFRAAALAVVIVIIVLVWHFGHFTVSIG